MFIMCSNTLFLSLPPPLSLSSCVCVLSCTFLGSTCVSQNLQISNGEWRYCGNQKNQVGRMLIMLSNTLFLFLFYLVLFLLQNVFPQNLQISNGKRRYCGESMEWGWKKWCCWSCFLTHYCLSPSSISNFFWLQKAWCKTPKFKWKMKIWWVSKERVLIMFSNTFSVCCVLDFSSFKSCCQNSKFK